MEVAIGALGKDHVDVGVVAGVLGRAARTDLQKHRLSLAAVLDLVAVRHARLETGAVARDQPRLAVVLNQDHLALDHPDELVLGAVPVTLAGPGPGG
ncbi:hypothetical protein D3C72_2117240 [compost metagenome]